MSKRRRGSNRHGDAPQRVPARNGAPVSPTRPRRVTALAGVAGIGGLVLVVAALGSTIGRGARPTNTLSPTGSVGSSPARPSLPADTGPVATLLIPCEPTEQIAYHVHAHLNIRLGGELQPVPARIGIQSTCFSWLHTHAAFGVIHVEAAEERPFSLGSFFDVWGQALGPGQVLDHVVAPRESVRVFVDGVPFEGDPRTVPLRDLEAIEIQVGTGALDPLPYTFPAEFR